MNHDLMFIKGNQKNFIRLSVEEEMLHTYELQMFTHNKMKSFLPFQRRSQNGQEYLYYDISGTQSLDILLQTQKLKRPIFVLFAKELLRLCKNINEYMLSIGCVVFDAKFIMYKADSQEIQFLYTFWEVQNREYTFSNLLEYCIDYLDYSDRELSESVFRLYEHLQEQGENFLLERELEICIELLEKEEMKEEVLSKKERIVEAEIEPIEIVISEEAEHKVDVYEPSEKKRKRGLLILLCIDVIGILLWKPLTILKICFFFSFGVFLLVLYVYICRSDFERTEKRRKESEAMTETYMNEYENIALQSNVEEDGTQFICIENMRGMLYNLQGLSPQYIHITETPQLIGKDREKVQICISSEGISRVHASIVKKGEVCILEDLCSTNGTWVNGENIGIRVPYVLKEGDHIQFAGAEYIFR